MAKKDKDPQEDIKKLNEVIASGAFKNVHLLCGEEDYLRLQFRDKLTKACGGEPGSMSYDRFIGKDTVPEKIIDLAETMPFFTDRRVILIEDSGWFKNGCEAIAAYIEQGVCESTCMIFCEKEIDKRSKLFKAVSTNGMVSEFPEQTAQTLRAWIVGQLKKLGTAISPPDAEYMISRVGTDMVMLQTEMDKLSAYCMDKGAVSRADIDAICIRQLEDKVFEMCEAVAMSKKDRALAIYFDLIGLRESPVKILVLLTGQFNTLLKIKDLEQRRYSDDMIGQKIGRPGWTIRNYKNQTSRYTRKELADIVEMCADADESFKSGRMTDSLAVETLLVQLVTFHSR